MVCAVNFITVPTLSKMCRASNVNSCTICVRCFDCTKRKINNSFYKQLLPLMLIYIISISLNSFYNYDVALALAHQVLIVTVIVISCLVIAVIRHFEKENLSNTNYSYIINKFVYWQPIGFWVVMSCFSLIASISMVYWSARFLNCYPFFSAALVSHVLLTLSSREVVNMVSRHIIVPSLPLVPSKKEADAPRSKSQSVRCL